MLFFSAYMNYVRSLCFVLFSLCDTTTFNNVFSRSNNAKKLWTIKKLKCIQISVNEGIWNCSNHVSRLHEIKRDVRFSDSIKNCSFNLIQCEKKNEFNSTGRKKCCLWLFANKSFDIFRQKLQFYMRSVFSWDDLIFSVSFVINLLLVKKYLYTSKIWSTKRKDPKE